MVLLTLTIIDLAPVADTADGGECSALATLVLVPAQVKRSVWIAPSAASEGVVVAQSVASGTFDCVSSHEILLLYNADRNLARQSFDYGQPFGVTSVIRAPCHG